MGVSSGTSPFERIESIGESTQREESALSAFAFGVA
ncbi:hypothetical protein CCACVL1_30378 [Corchorus capsularis]|uniref:Uncharacterized protein n=1 Tax=Corchorus capsularis TaxID=210143 RepID=A0A1R3FXJ1_COCAP|nr:hypothetical protein CCACVL1_30378 [Corchorus capsularis]